MAKPAKDRSSRQYPSGRRTAAAVSADPALSPYEQYLQRWRQSPFNPARVLVIVIVVVVVGLSLAAPARTYYRQRTEKEALIAENAQLVKDIARKEQQLAVQNDPKMIEEQARRRLLLIPRGETGFRVILPGKEEQRDLQQQVNSKKSFVLNGDGPWYRDLWRSVSVPDPNNNPSQ